jgi:hypothetical protein
VAQAHSKAYLLVPVKLRNRNADVPLPVLALLHLRRRLGHLLRFFFSIQLLRVNGTNGHHLDKVVQLAERLLPPRDALQQFGRQENGGGYHQL